MGAVDNGELVEFHATCGRRDPLEGDPETPFPNPGVVLTMRGNQLAQVVYVSDTKNLDFEIRVRSSSA